MRVRGECFSASMRIGVCNFEVKVLSVLGLELFVFSEIMVGAKGTIPWRDYTSPPGP